MVQNEAPEKIFCRHNCHRQLCVAFWQQHTTLNGCGPPPWRTQIREIRDRFQVKTFFRDHQNFATKIKKSVIDSKGRPFFFSSHLKKFPLSISDCGCMPSPPHLKTVDTPLALS